MIACAQAGGGMVQGLGGGGGGRDKDGAEEIWIRRAGQAVTGVSAMSKVHSLPVGCPRGAGPPVLELHAQADPAGRGAHVCDAHVQAHILVVLVVVAPPARPAACNERADGRVDNGLEDGRLTRGTRRRGWGQHDC